MALKTHAILLCLECFSLVMCLKKTHQKHNTGALFIRFNREVRFWCRFFLTDRKMQPAGFLTPQQTSVQTYIEFKGMQIFGAFLALKVPIMADKFLLFTILNKKLNIIQFHIKISIRFVNCNFSVSAKWILNFRLWHQIFLSVLLSSTPFTRGSGSPFLEFLCISPNGDFIMGGEMNERRNPISILSSTFVPASTV